MNPNREDTFESEEFAMSAINNWSSIIVYINYSQLVDVQAKFTCHNVFSRIIHQFDLSKNWSTMTASSMPDTNLQNIMQKLQNEKKHIK